MANTPMSNNNFENIISSGFSYWKQTWLFQLLFNGLYISIFLLVFFHFSEKLGIMESYLDMIQKNLGNYPQLMTEMQNLVKEPEFETFSTILLATNTLLFPLNLGLYKILRNVDNKTESSVMDLFGGYSGINFFIYCGFFLFWQLVYNLVAPTLILGFVWVGATLFCAPLMFFKGIGLFESLVLSWRSFRKHFLLVLLIVALSAFLKYFGILSVLFAIFTFSVWHCLIYASFKILNIEGVVDDKSGANEQQKIS